MPNNPNLVQDQLLLGDAGIAQARRGRAVAVPRILAGAGEGDDPWVAQNARAAFPQKSATPHSVVATIFGVGAPQRWGLGAIDKYCDAQSLVIKSPHPIVDPKSLVGIEVEVENVQYINPNITVGPAWLVESDGSLRNSGREFKTLAIPLVAAERLLTRLFTGLNSDVDFSVRTSVHIHQDVRSLTSEQLLVLLFTYLTVEPLFFKYAGNNRKNSVYCVPLLNTGLLDADVTAAPTDKVIRLVRQWAKYSALNLAPVANFGTVEYRHMPGTNNIPKLMGWLDLISRLKVWAYKISYQQAVDMICNLNTNSQYYTYLDAVFGNATRLLDQSELGKDMDEAVWRVKNATILNEFDQYITTNYNKESDFADLTRVPSLTENWSAKRKAAWETFRKTEYMMSRFGDAEKISDQRIYEHFYEIGYSSLPRDCRDLLNIVYQRDVKRVEV